MLTVLLVIQVIVAVAMVVVILIQRSASDGLAGLGGGGGNSLLSGRASANILTKTTSILAAVFMANSLLMGTIVSRGKSSADSILEKTQDEAPVPKVPAADTLPIVPQGTEKAADKKEAEKPSSPSVPKVE